MKRWLQKISQSAMVPAESIDSLLRLRGGATIGYGGHVEMTKRFSGFLVSIILVASIVPVLRGIDPLLLTSIDPGGPARVTL